MGEQIVYPEDLETIVDVTQPPYCADNTGQTDCTAVLIQAIDDVVRPDLDALKETVAVIEHEPDRVFRASEISFAERQRILKDDPKAVVGLERCSGTFPYTNQPARILYFPNGTYLVSDTIVYSFEDLQNASGKELNRCLHFQGQSRDGVVLKLQDHAPKFGDGANRPVVSFTRGNPSNVAMQHTFKHFTIDVGVGNSGAIGLEFFANNTGAIRDVTIRSGDPERAGYAGLSFSVWNSSCALVKNVRVEGFDYGVRIAQDRLYTVLEHIDVVGQRIAGVCVQDNNVALRGLKSENAVPAVRLEGDAATLALVDGDFSGGDNTASAIDFDTGFLFARNIQVDGYDRALRHKGELIGPEGDLEEYVSHACPSVDQADQVSLGLPIEETPDIPWEQDLDEWVSVHEFGAVGDGMTDDSDAIQQAMRSGKSVVYFEAGPYLIDRTIEIPASVARVNFMFCDLVVGGRLQEMDGQGAFRIVGERDVPLVMEDLFAFERWFGAHYLIDHASPRTLVLRDMQTQIGAMYRNSVSGGRVFLENVASTDQFSPNRNSFHFTGQQVWARQLNPERAHPEVLNDGSKLWVLGFKTEGCGTSFEALNGGSTEVLGGIFNLSRKNGPFEPSVVNRDSEVSIFASTTDHRKTVPQDLYPVVEETRNGVISRLDWSAFPIRMRDLIVVPLYVSRG